MAQENGHRPRGCAARALLLLLLVAAAALYVSDRTGIGRRFWFPLVISRRGARTLEAALAEAGPSARARLLPAFARTGLPYPPARVTLIGLKAERRLELWAATTGEARHVADYPILAASGGPGPKLREGDRQVPEGIYPVTFLNPNSSYHLSLRLGYPNADDLRHAAEEGRSTPGGDIMIHGKAVSIGCLAMGDPAIEELFTLAADVGIGSVEALLLPHDLRVLPPPAPPGAPAWLAERYADLTKRIARLKR